MKFQSKGFIKHFELPETNNNNFQQDRKARLQILKIKPY
ncbi:unnamed protein product [Paramecium octaurelia]|uniref:Uncharacterized protein n=1 Tax=Paramecium octaurelia TaxID=43137 RepID=A0A8S1U447_PAROT|nr:unnamed protein product [Paramecium octaurelia]